MAYSTPTTLNIKDDPASLFVSRSNPRGLNIFLNESVLPSSDDIYDISRWLVLNSKDRGKEGRVHPIMFADAFQNLHSY